MTEKPAAVVTKERITAIQARLDRGEVTDWRAIRDLLAALSFEQERADAAEREVGIAVRGWEAAAAERDALKLERNKLRLAFDDALQQLAVFEAERSVRMRRVLGGEEG